MEETKKIQYCAPEVIDFQWMNAIGLGCVVTGSGASDSCQTHGNGAGSNCDSNGNTAAKSCGCVGLGPGTGTSPCAAGS